MTKQEVINAAVVIVDQLTKENGIIPKDTGNMAFNSIAFTVEDDIIHINIVPEIAPYAPFTNEPWTSEKWHGKENPNAGWWQRFTEEFAKRLATRLRGELK